jgi:hypothetical protein
LCRRREERKWGLGHFLFCNLCVPCAPLSQLSLAVLSTIPIFHHSIIPTFQHSIQWAFESREVDETGMRPQTTKKGRPDGRPFSVETQVRD